MCRSRAAYLGVKAAIEAGQHRERLRGDRRITRKGRVGDRDDIDVMHRDGGHERLPQPLGGIGKIDVGLAVKHKNKLQAI